MHCVILLMFLLYQHLNAQPPRKSVIYYTTVPGLQLYASILLHCSLAQPFQDGACGKILPTSSVIVRGCKLAQ